VGPKEKHYLCVGFEIEIHEFSDDINIGCEPQGTGKNIFWVRDIVRSRKRKDDEPNWALLFSAILAYRA